MKAIEIKSATLGKNISAVEVTNVSVHGLWLFAGEKEYFLPYADYPWFENAPVNRVVDVVELSAGHFHWPQLDVDLSLEILEHTDRFPLKAKAADTTA